VVILPKKKSYILKLKVPENELIRRLEEEGFSFKRNPKQVEIWKKTDVGRIHGHLYYSPGEINRTTLEVHEDMFSGLPIRFHFVRYPSRKVERVLEKILKPILRGLKSPPFYFSSIFAPAVSNFFLIS